MSLIGKKILLIAPKFHALHEKIIMQIEELGAKVSYVDERPNNDFFTKFFIRMKWKFLISRSAKKYYFAALENIKNKKFDVILVISLESIPHEVLEKLKLQQNSAKFILYMWDSQKLKPIAKDTAELFDKVFTFDPQDAKEYNFYFLPLFYSKEYQSVIGKKIKVKYDFVFIGTIHGHRYIQLENLKKHAKEFGMSVFFYYYMPSKILFYVKKIVNKSFWKLRFSDVNFKSLSADDIAIIISESRAVIDLSQKKQVGLSMRTFEALGMKKKLITTNQSVINYDFYNTSNIQLMDQDDLILDKRFLNESYSDLSEKIYKKYSLRKWIEFILES